MSRLVSNAAHNGALFCRDLCAGLLKDERRADAARMLRRKIAQCDEFAKLPFVPSLWKDLVPR